METKRFGTFEGVFTPTVLSILGVVMYLRLGWVVGQTGLAGAVLIIMISNLITFCTGLSVASITTNIRIGTGGAYSIISRSLGLEVGGAIGIPLYLSQAISVAFYITGFTECWVSIFPHHNFAFISGITWFVLLVISYASAKLAFRLQYVVMGIIVFSLISIFLGKSGFSPPASFLHGAPQDTDFWKVFAIFFPAVTGILAGVSMSGELKKPERNIPLGMLWAIGVTFFLYLIMSFWFAFAAPYTDLVKNTSLIIELARWRSVVIAGIMGATLSSALSMFVASPRTLLALSKNKVVPFPAFSHFNSKGEPAPAILFTAALALITLSLGTLNAIAVILTMFFLITYGILNITVFAEKITGIASFRPTFKIPVVVSLIGGAGCLYAMFLINQLFSLVAIAATVCIYFILVRRQIRHNLPDMRKGIFIFFAEQAARISQQLPYHPKIWKPNLLIPVEDPRKWTELAEFIKTVVYPRGRAECLTIVGGAEGGDGKKRERSLEELSRLIIPLREEGIFASALAAEAHRFLDGATTVMQILTGSVLPPNVLFAKLGVTSEKDGEIKELIVKAETLGMGIIIFNLHPRALFGRKQTINLWIRKGSPNIHLAVLVGLQLARNWEGNFRLIQVVSEASRRQDTLEYLQKLKRLTRLGEEAQVMILAGSFEESVANAPPADINIFGVSTEYDTRWLRKISGRIGTSTLFLKDSEQENAIV